MSTPAVRAASRSDVPSATATGRPSIVRLIVLTSAMNALGETVRQPSGRGGGAERTPLAVDVRFEFVTPLLNARYDWDRARVAEYADGLAGHGVADLEQRVEIGHASLARLDTLHDLGRPRRAFAALR